ncbi:nitroreductase family protein [Candidatus Bathyarchaeota archaeon]|nr:MAG: nitroreductase family protein [Candidatus Bathyarchaeota archaeon]
MDVFEAIFTRRSVRQFSKKDVSNEDLKKILEAGTWAPSAGNVQPWEVIVVKNHETKLRLAEAALHQDFIGEASVVLVVCVDLDMASLTYGERGKTLYCIQDSAAAIQNMLLAVHALGLGACWIGAFHEETVKKILGIPPRYRPVALIPIGYPTYSPRRISKKTVDEIVHFEKF